MKKLFTILAVLFSMAASAQNTHTQSNAHTNEQFQGVVEAKKGFINGWYADTTAANFSWIKDKPFAQIATDSGTIWIRNNLATKWLFHGSIDYVKTLISDSIRMNSPLSNGLTSTGNITLVDSTLTIGDTIRYTISGTDYVQTIPSVFTINSADSGYYRRDLIYADATGLHKLVGEQDTLIGVKPKLPLNSIEVTTVDVYGKQIIPPTPNIITPIPNLQQVTNEGNTTTNPIVINNNSSQTSVRINGNFNRSYYYYGKNANSGHWANVGAIFKNDVADNPNNEHSGHFLQLLMGSTNSDFMKDGGMIRVKGTGGLRLTSDSGRITFGNGAPFQTYPWVEFGAFETNGDFGLRHVDSLNADLNNIAFFDGSGIFKRGSIGDIDVLQNTIDSSSFGVKKLDGTVKNVVIYADGLTSDGSGIQTIQPGTGVTIDNTDPLNPIISASGVGGTYTASNGLTMSGSDVQLGGALTSVVNIATGVYTLNVSTTSSGATPLNVTSTTSSAITATSVSQPGVFGKSTSSTGVVGQSSSGVGGSFYSGSYIALDVITDNVTFNTPSAQFTKTGNTGNNVLVNIALKREDISGTISNGIGQSLVFDTKYNVDSSSYSNQLISKWIDIAPITRTSEFSITGVNSATTQTLLKISGAGVFTLVQGLTNYTDNAAAIAGGLTTGQLYRNGDIVQIVH